MVARGLIARRRSVSAATSDGEVPHSPCSPPGHPPCADGFAWMVGCDLARLQRVGNANVQIGADEREIIVAAIPHKNVSFYLSCARGWLRSPHR